MLPPFIHHYFTKVMASASVMSSDLFTHAGSNAPPLTQGELQAITAEHASWLESEGREGKRANLRGADLRSCRFENLNLAEASLRNANLEKVIFSDCDLHGADFAESMLESAQFLHCRLDGAIFTRARAVHSEWNECSAQKSDWSDANLHQATIAHGDFSQAILRGAELEGATLDKNNFREAAFRGANVSHATIGQCDFTQAEFRDANCGSSAFIECNLSDALFRGAELGGVELHLSDFSKALEVEPHYYMRYIGEARKTLQTEKEAFGQIQGAFTIQRDEAEAILKDAEALFAKLRGTRMALLAAALLWVLLSLFLLGLIVASLGSVRLSDFRAEEIILLSIIFAAPPLLFAYAATEAFLAARAVRRFRAREDA